MRTSIIIPVYNRAQLLARAVHSIPITIDAEIIIVDDGSSDGTSAVATELARKDERIRVVVLEENQGVNYARNRGVEVANSDWIQLLDSDDAFVSGGAETVSKKLDAVSPDIDIVGFMTARETAGIMQPRGYRVGEQWGMAHPKYEDILLKRDIRGDVHYCIRKRVFSSQRFFEDVPGFETEFFALVAKRGAAFLYVDEIVDERYSGADYHLSNAPFKKWPRKFARAYKRFVIEHKEVLSRHPTVLRHFYRRIALCSFLSGNVSGFWWILKAQWLDVKKVKKLRRKVLVWARSHSFTKKKNVRIKFLNNQFRIVLNPENGYVDKTIYLNRNWEEDVGKILSDTLREGSVFVDIGANIGYFSILASQMVGNTGKVLSFEPLEACRAQLEESMLMNKFQNIQVFPYACGSVESSSTIYIRRRNIGGSSLFANLGKGKPAPVDATQTVKVVKLDDKLKGEKKIDMIKIDVEGLEFEVLRGAVEVLRRCRPILVIEYSPHFYEQLRIGMTSEFNLFLRECGYGFFDATGRAVDLEELSRALFESKSQSNIVCRPNR